MASQTVCWDFKPAFQKLSNTDSFFFCPHCRLDRQESTIKYLLDTIKSLKEDISNIKEKSCVQSCPRHFSDKDSAPTRSFVSVVQSTSHQQSVPSKPHFSSQERKFSLVIGIDECPQGTSHQVRLDSDQKQVISVLSSLMPDISKLSVRDCTRMGKYSPSHVRPRPLLVKLLRTTEVSVILSNRSKLTKSKVYIKPYMTPSERNSRSILLKERKSLISSGASPKDIKIKSNKLLLKWICLWISPGLLFFAQCPEFKSSFL